MAQAPQSPQTNEAPALRPTRIDSARWMRLTAWVFAISLILAAALGWPAVRNIETTRLNVIAAQQQGHLAAAKTLFEREISECITDLRVMTEAPALQMFLEARSPARLEGVNRLFLAAAAGYRRYDQIRMLDLQGREVLRVNFNNGHPAVAPAWALQHKADRPYFKRAVALPKGGLYVSGIDANMELGKLEIPLKPVIRVATPVFSPSGEKAGVLVFNYLAERLQVGLSKIIANNPLGMPMVVNEAGYWVSHPDASKLFNDLVDAPSVQRFSEQYVDEWAAMLNKPEGQLITDQGMFSYAMVAPRLLADAVDVNQDTQRNSANSLQSDGAMYLMFHVPASVLAVEAVRSAPWLWFVVGLVALLLLVLSLGGSFVLVFREAQIATAQRFAQHMARMAHVDELTGVINRRYFHELAQRELNRVGRVREPLVALMLDIDFFKRVNDQHGHKTGDDVLKAFSRACESQLRKTDVFGRLGGEEFAVLMPDTPLGMAAMVAERLRSAVEAMVLTHGNDVSIPVTVSIGMAVFSADSDSLDALLTRADAALYQAKSQGRNRVVVFSELAPVPKSRLTA